LRLLVPSGRDALVPGPLSPLAGRVALVTGAARGIGLGVARELSRAGCAVAIQDIDAEAATAAATALEREGGRAVALVGDVGDLAHTATLVDATVERLGALDILVNNAAIALDAAWESVPLVDVERQLRVDLIAPLILCQRAAIYLRGRRWGRILNLGSIHQRNGFAMKLVYGMCKAALENMTRALARDLARDGITVNLIAPGYFHTHHNRDDFPNAKAKEEAGRRMVPAGRIGEIEDCGGLALLLCTDAGSYITGQSIYVDGGMTTR
jgi:NAD(P)-dependent dehydrogenase (short-subunit alcohol dehydrogenase family)